MSGRSPSIKKTRKTSNIGFCNWNAELGILEVVRMNRIIQKWIGVVIIGASILFGAPFFFEYFDSKIESKSVTFYQDQIRLPDRIVDSLKTGDLIFRKGYGPITDVISELIESGPYDLTHCGIIMRKNTDVFVAHAISNKSQKVDGVVLQPLSLFLKTSRPSNIHIVRWDRYTQEMSSEVEGHIDSLIQLKIPFDRKANYHDSKALYCNEMIVKIWMNNLHLIEQPRDDKEHWGLFNNLSVLYDEKVSSVVYTTFK